MTYQHPKRHPLKDIYAGRHDSHPYHRDLFQPSSGDAAFASTASSMKSQAAATLNMTSTALPSLLAAAAPANEAPVGDSAFAYAPPPPPAAAAATSGSKWYRDVNGNDLREYPFKGRPDATEQVDRDIEDKINQQYQRYQMFGPPAGSQTSRPSTTASAFSSSSPTPLRFAGASSTMASNPRWNATAAAVTQRLHPASLRAGEGTATARPWTTSSANAATYRPPHRYHHPSLFTPQHTQQYFPQPTVDPQSGLHVYNAAEISWPSSHINYLLSAGARQQDAALGFQPTANYEYHYQRFFPAR